MALHRRSQDAGVRQGFGGRTPAPVAFETVVPNPKLKLLDQMRQVMRAEQWEVLNRQIPLLGEINYEYFGGKDEFDHMVKLAKEHARK